MAAIQYLIRRVRTAHPNKISTSTTQMMLDYTLAVSLLRQWRLAYPDDRVELLRREISPWLEVEVE